MLQVLLKRAGRFLGHPNVPLLGLGLAAIGRPGYINVGHSMDLPDKSVESMRTQSERVLDAAYAAGVRYMDAARSYGKAEDFLSGWLRERSLRRVPPGAAVEEGAVLVGSKWGYVYTADWQVDTGGQPHEVKMHTADNLVKQTRETVNFLGGHLNLYQIHSATLDSGVLDNADVLAELARLKSERGWKIGLSLSGVLQGETLRRAMQVNCEGQPLFDCVQATWNLLEQSAGPALQEAHAAGLSVIVKEGMANGRLLQRSNPRLAPLFAAADRLLAVSAAASPSSSGNSAASGPVKAGADALALACVIVQPFRPMVLSGASTPEQLRSNALALQLADQPDIVELAEELKRQLVVEPKAYWEERSALAWN